MPAIKMIHLEGYIDANKIEENKIQWLSVWANAARKAQLTNSTIVAFKIPNLANGQQDSQLIQIIEQTIQQNLNH